jgi:hypothetical protein
MSIWYEELLVSVDVYVPESPLGPELLSSPQAERVIAAAKAQLKTMLFLKWILIVKPSKMFA